MKLPDDIPEEDVARARVLAAVRRSPDDPKYVASIYALIAEAEDAPAAVAKKLFNDTVQLVLLPMAMTALALTGGEGESSVGFGVSAAGAIPDPDLAKKVLRRFRKLWRKEIPPEVRTGLDMICEIVPIDSFWTALLVTVGVLPDEE